MEANLKSLYEVLIEQKKAIRHATLQVESLKSMFFEHRAAFIEIFPLHENKMAASERIRAFDQQIAELEQVLARINAEMP